jgi:diaminohydroxyphosphoribosylaminopyrimidine deaminase/5-amino-6-(5-phosphoribosylamino)uracil reductase
VIVAGSRPLPASADIWQRHPLVLSNREIEVPAGELVLIAAASTGGVDLRQAIDHLGHRGLLRVFVEGGSGIASSLIRSGLVDVGLLHLGGKFALGAGRPMFGGVFETIDAAADVDIISAEMIEGDLEVRWRLRRS